ncbi:MAG TPA: zf-HC2 domain-containing protein [Polyangiales bacterium]|nr:zf-HC2 domain-containing protein [Polyangiales bacterium]
MNCSAIERCVDGLVDQEIDSSTRFAVEAHVESCSACKDRVEFAHWMKKNIAQHGRMVAPEALRARVQEALEVEANPRFARLDANWISTAAVAAIALVVFGVGGVMQLKGPHVAARLSPLFEDVVRAHTRSYPAEVARREMVPAYFAGKVDFDVQPVDFGDPAVRFVGARHVEVGGRHGVTLQYERLGHKMTVVAFRSPPRAFDDEAERAAVSGHDVRYVRVGAHVVPLIERGSVVYAVVGDEPEDGLRLAGQAAQH